MQKELPFAAVTRPQAHNDAIIDTCQLWIAEHYDVSSPVEQVTEYSGLFEPSFSGSGFGSIRIQKMRAKWSGNLFKLKREMKILWIVDMCE